ncbi:MAG: DUF4388 domain-containing protein [Deltaproteobacteria bacterium]|nr:DUF4388 domain-containing protein [Deltaproteobacteria bacterium]
MSLVGNLVDLPLTDIFQIVTLSKRTGILKIVSAEHPEQKAAITFLDGNIIKASSSPNRSPLGVFLISRGLITEAQRDAALSIQEQTMEPLATILVRQRVIPRETIEPILMEYIQRVIFDLLKWDEGHFEFKLLSSPKEVLPPYPSEFVLRDGIPTQHLIIEGLRLLDEEKHREAASGSETKGPIGFASLMEDSPVSLSEPEGPPPADGHPEGLWESVQDEIDTAENKVTASLVEEKAAPPSEKKDLDFLEELILEVGDEMELPEPETEQKEIVSLKAMVEELKGPSSLSEVLLLILRYASEFLSRAALFVIRDGEIRGFGQFGLPGEDNQANDRIRNLVIPAAEDSILTEAIRRRARVVQPLAGTTRWNTVLLETLGGIKPEESLVIPVNSGTETLALFYGDNGEKREPIGDIEALEIFIIQAGMVLDRSDLERKLHDMQRH